MKKSIFASIIFATAMAMAFSASASGNGNGNNGNGNGNGGGNNGNGNGNGGGTVGGSVSVYSGTVGAAVTSVSKGEAISATLISGNGWSHQSTVGTTSGVAQAGGIINSDGVQIVTSTFQSTDFASVGAIGGGAQAVNGGSEILNGTQGFGSVENNAFASGTFNKAVVGISAIGSISGN